MAKRSREVSSMKLVRILCYSLALAPLLALTACGGFTNLGSFSLSTGTGLQPVTTTISISPLLDSVAAGSSVTFTGDTSGTTTAPTWQLLYAANLQSQYSVGTLSQPSADTVIYTAPATPPLYTFGSTGNPSGTVSLTATLPGTTPLQKTISFVITTPSVIPGISPTTASVALGSTFQIYAWVVGTLNNSFTLQVDGQTNGTNAFGVIGPAGYIEPNYINSSGGYIYYAPTTMPITGSTVTITVVSQADPTKTASAVITLH
jgi:hypothetical protein